MFDVCATCMPPRRSRRGGAQGGHTRQDRRVILVNESLRDGRLLPFQVKLCNRLKGWIVHNYRGVSELASPAEQAAEPWILRCLQFRTADTPLTREGSAADPTLAIQDGSAGDGSSEPESEDSGSSGSIIVVDPGPNPSQPLAQRPRSGSKEPPPPPPPPGPPPQLRQQQPRSSA